MRTSEMKMNLRGRKCEGHDEVVRLCVELKKTMMLFTCIFSSLTTVFVLYFQLCYWS